MRKTRKCAFCGKEFTCNSGSQRYCSEQCAEAAKAQRKKRQQDFLKAVQPVIDIASQEYLTFSKAAILMISNNSVKVQLSMSYEWVSWSLFHHAVKRSYDLKPIFPFLLIASVSIALPSLRALTASTGDSKKIHTWAPLPERERSTEQGMFQVLQTSTNASTSF